MLIVTFLPIHHSAQPLGLLSGWFCSVIARHESGGVAAGDTIMDLDTNYIAMLLLSQDMDMDSPRTRTWSSCRFLACMLEVVSVVFV